MDEHFYRRNSGAQLVEELLKDAQHQAGSFQVVVNNYLFYFMVHERLPELKAQLEEQTKVVERLRLEIEKAQKKNVKNAGAAERERYAVERDALAELQRAITVLEGKNHQPEIPAWLSGFLRDAMREGMAENGRFQKK